jgi:CDP-glycerol glycerophosphotransferase (TagB/SpsB family)
MQPGAGRYLLYASEVYALAVLRPLQAAVRRCGGRTAWFFDGPGAHYLEADERRLRDLSEVREFDPTAIFVPGNLVPDFFPGVKVEVFHGFSVGKRSESRGHFRIRGLFDLYCTQGPTTTPPFRELARRHGHFQVVETGWPKVDPLFRAPEEPANPWTVGWSAKRPLILFASTFTPSLSAAPRLLETIRELSAHGDWNWLVTLHPKMSPDIVRQYRALEGTHLRYAETDDIVPLLQAAEVMVSDTSSVVHEFLLQRKPVVTLCNARPGPHLIDIAEPGQLGPAVGHALGRPAQLMQEISAFAESIHPYRDGRSSDRVLEATHNFIEHGRSALKPKPLNLWRRLQLRRRLGYYRWS